MYKFLLFWMVNPPNVIFYPSQAPRSFVIIAKVLHIIGPVRSNSQSFGNLPADEFVSIWPFPAFARKKRAEANLSASALLYLLFYFLALSTSLLTRSPPSRSSAQSSSSGARKRSLRRWHAAGLPSGKSRSHWYSREVPRGLYRPRSLSW